MVEEMRKALADYLGLDLEEVVYNPDSENYGYGYGTEFFTPEGTYRVYDEDEATQGVRDDIENLIDDIGLDGLGEPLKSWIYSNALNDDYFKDRCYEDYYGYAQDIESEHDDQYGNRLLKECVEDFDLISGFDVVDGEYIGDDDLYDLVANYMVDRIGNEYDSYASWVEQEFGAETLQLWANDAGIDYDAVAKYIIDMDGYGPSLSRWDGDEHDLEGDYMAFKDDEDDRRDEVSE